MTGQVTDITGQKKGRLTAIRYTGRNTKTGHNAIWLFRCDCGNYVERPRVMLNYSKTPSCGCYVKDHASQLNKTHGGRNERLYLVWMDMRRRCYDEKDANYFRYGGRGIKVCDQWKDYATFREWANKNGYDPVAVSHQCTLDRINVNGNYSPENCRWVDSKVQCNNKRNNKRIEYMGETHTLSEWADKFNLRYGLVARRINAGWEPERAFTQPARVTKRTIIHG